MNAQHLMKQIITDINDWILPDDGPIMDADEIQKFFEYLQKYATDNRNIAMAVDLCADHKSVPPAPLCEVVIPSRKPDTERVGKSWIAKFKDWQL